MMLFKGDLSFLSNFYDSPIVWKEKTWPTVEHAFQASKTDCFSHREDIRKILSPGKAKRMGRRVVLRKDWEEVKVDVMVELVWCKFDQYPYLKSKLLATRDLELVEGNYWHDNFWGDCYCDKCTSSKGANILGFILMGLREIFRM